MRRLGRRVFFLGGGGEEQGAIIDVKTLSLRYCTFLICRYSATSVLGLHEHFFIIFLNKTDIKLSFFLASKCYTVRILSFFKAKLVRVTLASLGVRSIM